MGFDSRFHIFSKDELRGVDLPEKFTYPFHYTPHTLCRIASRHLIDYLGGCDSWQDELEGGKMMGVLVVERGGELGYLAAYSGNLGHVYNHEYFVPAVCDLLSSDGFFAIEEQAISNLNDSISELISSEDYLSSVNRVNECRRKAEADIDEYRRMMAKSKARRDELRIAGACESMLIAESQYQKAELRRLKMRWRERIDECKKEVDVYLSKVEALKRERQGRSVALQRLVFERFEMLNARGERRNLNDIFMLATGGLPPSGAGECAAPKMLHYAFANGYRPVAMAEFWVGRSPKDEVRRHGDFYGSCKSKCEPILGWMLQGLDVEPNPLEGVEVGDELRILYEDQWIVAVDKPAGMLSVAGKLSVDSLEERMRVLYMGEELRIVHRLDMATSGVLLFARTLSVYRDLQGLFKSQRIRKSYVALLDGEVKEDSGEIRLPLVLNPDDRPRQMVSEMYGKRALTRYEVLSREGRQTRVKFYPITGRTHQLRVHAAHCDGLNAPIVGDTLYGRGGERLFLHAESVGFIHPVTHEDLFIISKVPF